LQLDWRVAPNLSVWRRGIRAQAAPNVHQFTERAFSTFDTPGIACKKDVILTRQRWPQTAEEIQTVGRASCTSLLAVSETLKAATPRVAEFIHLNLCYAEAGGAKLNQIKTPKGHLVDLNVVWKQRCELRTKGFELLAEADKLHAKAESFVGGYKIEVKDVERWVEGENLYIESYNVKAEAWRLFAEGDKLWADAILTKYGNIKIEWIKRVEEEIKLEEGRYLGKDCDCKLETGELFEWR
jgi:hypothetical protein